MQPLLTPDELDPPDLTERQEEFLRLVEAGAKDSEAAAALGINRVTAYRWKKNDPAFAARYEEMRRVTIERLVKEAERRALHGSDKLLEFLLCNYAPDRFQRAQRIDQNVNGSMSMVVMTGVPDTEDGSDLL